MQKHKYDGGLTKLFIEQAPLTHGFLPFCQHKLGLLVVVVWKNERVISNPQLGQVDIITWSVQFIPMIK